MKRRGVLLLMTVLFLSLTLSTISLAQIAEEDALPIIKELELLPVIDDSLLTYQQFRSAVAKAWPGKEDLIEDSNEAINRSDYLIKLIEVLDLQGEAANYKDVTTMANDENQVPLEAIGAFTLAYRSNHQLLNYRYGHLLEPLSPITTKEAAISLYMALYPPEQGGIITTAIAADAPSFNNLFTSSGLTWTICNIIGDGITGPDADNIYIPRMVKRIPSLENGLMKVNNDGSMTITYELRKGMKWHDGIEVTAHDAKFQWEVMTSEAPVSSSYYEKTVSEVKVIDDYTYSIHLDQAMGDAKYGSSVYGYYYGWFNIPEHLFREDFEKAQSSGKWEEFVQKVNKNPILTGPYKLKENVEGQHIVLEAFDEYFMGRPNIDEIVLKIIPDSDVIYAATINGEVDFGRYTHTLNQSIQLEKEHGDKFNVFFEKNIVVDYLDLNFRDPEDLSKENKFFSDIKVRQAILHAINREQINNVVYHGKGIVCDTWITEMHQMRDALNGPHIHKYPYDPIKARELLTAAGWQPNNKGIMEKDGLPFEFVLNIASGSNEQELSSQVIQGMLKKVGISVKIDAKPALVFWTEIMPQGKFDALLTGWGYGITDEAVNYWNSSCIPSKANSYGGNNFTGWTNQENDQVSKAALNELDFNKKVDFYKKHFELWTKELPVIPLISSPTPNFAKKGIKSFSSGYMNGLGWIIYNWYLGN